MFSVSLKCRMGVIRRRIKGIVQCNTFTQAFGMGWGGGPNLSKCWEGGESRINV